MNSELMALADRCEAAAADEQGRLLEHAWEASASASANFRRFATSHPPRGGFGSYADKFAMALEAMAYESAAIMLVPQRYRTVMVREPDDKKTKKWLWCLAAKYGHGRWGKRRIYGSAETPALALTAAALRAIAGAME